MDIKKMRACTPLLPDPCGEVVNECLGEIERLRAALEPFADHPDFHAPDDWAVTWINAEDRIPGVTAGDFRRARAALDA